jgi:hypothetical protein
MLVALMVVVLLCMKYLLLSRVNDLSNELLLLAFLWLLLIVLVRAYSLRHLVQLLKQLIFIGLQLLLGVA